mmetsp:Transcript_46496/g.73487  ORF Transcript_46496/g.73487 Transcript_46496/m.73487 type:complete len:228 (+) Transcript_46496:495-1178(+)
MQQGLYQHLRHIFTRDASLTLFASIIYADNYLSLPAWLIDQSARMDNRIWQPRVNQILFSFSLPQQNIATLYRAIWQLFAAYPIEHVRWIRATHGRANYYMSLGTACPSCVNLVFLSNPIYLLRLSIGEVKDRAPSHWIFRTGRGRLCRCRNNDRFAVFNCSGYRTLICNICHYNFINRNSVFNQSFLALFAAHYTYRLKNIRLCQHLSKGKLTGLPTSSSNYNFAR